MKFEKGLRSQNSKVLKGLATTKAYIWGEGGKKAQVV
jgi:hypothetical protein